MHASINSTFSTGDVGADLLSNGTARIRLGNVTVFLHAPADCDALIAAAVEAKRLLDPPAPPVEPSCLDKYEHLGSTDYCQRVKGHDGQHVGRQNRRWTPANAPVITDSGRTCDERNPDGSGEPCHRGGDHGVHRDANGDEWRTDLGNILDELPQAGQ